MIMYCSKKTALCVVLFVCIMLMAVLVILLQFLNMPVQYYIEYQQNGKLVDIDSVEDTLPKPLKDVVVYSAYFDDRARNGHSNVTVFFLIARRAIFTSKWIVGCGTGMRESSALLVRYVYEQKKRFLQYPYKQIALECYDLDAVNGSRAFVIYKTSSNGRRVLVESERPLFVPEPRVQPTGQYNFSLAVCTKAHNKEVPYLPEFIQYQKTIGVDHVHMSILETFREDGGLASAMEHPSVHEAVESGYLTISVWKEWHTTKETYDRSTTLQILDCFYRYRGTFDYISPMDTDDFFIPRTRGKTQFKDYIKDFCYTKPAVSCAFKWLELYPDICGMKGEVGKDGNVTKWINSERTTEHAKNVDKSVHSTLDVIDFTYHDAKCDHCLMPDMKVVHVPPHVAYAAHARLHRKYKKNKVC